MKHEPPVTPDDATSYHGPGFWVALVVGLAIAGYGLREYLSRYPDTMRRLALARWIIGADVAHDLLLAPLVVLVGFAIRRIVPKAALAAVQFGCLASGTLILLAWRPLHHSGAFKHNATVQPLNYAATTTIALGIVWAIALTWYVLRARVHPGHHHSSPSNDPTASG
jgi:hypothetical protein